MTETRIFCRWRCILQQWPLTLNAEVRFSGSSRNLRKQRDGTRSSGQCSPARDHGAAVGWAADFPRDPRCRNAAGRRGGLYPISAEDRVRGKGSAAHADPLAVSNQIDLTSSFTAFLMTVLSGGKRFAHCCSTSARSCLACPARAGTFSGR